MKIALFMILVVCAGMAFAQPVIKAVEVDPPPTIDGDISDACWQKAPSVTDFYFPSDGTKAAEPTTVWLCYDQKNIYMAFRCKDSQPDKIVAQQKKRGGDIGADDWVGFDLDCYCKYTHIVWFDVSAGGVQVEQLQTGDVSKIEWKGDWNAAVKRLDDGYAVELAVPFSILQYDANRTSMGIAFIRRHARANQWWWSPNVGPKTDARSFYLWDGLRLPRPKVRPDIMGYSLFGSGAGNSSRRLGLDIKHAITPSLTGLLTVNPDFRNIEQDVDSVDFSYNERYLPDKRPFFQEGMNHFPQSGIFYTRRIEDIDAGAQVSGRAGQYGIAAMHTSRLNTEDHSVVQISRQWENHTWLWLCGMHSELPGVHNTVKAAFFDQILREKGDRRVKMALTSIAATTASGDGQGKNLSGRVFYSGRPRDLQWGIEHDVVDADYDPYLGLVGDKGIRASEVWLSMYDELSSGKLSEWNASLDLIKTDRMNGTLFYNGISANGYAEFRNGSQVSLNLWSSSRPPYHDQVASFNLFWGGRDLFRNGGISLGIGKQAGGDYLHWSVGQGWGMSERLSVHGGYEFARIDEPSPQAFTSRQLIATIAYDLDTERTLGGRLIARSGKANFYLAYKQRVRVGTDAYVIFGDPNADSTRSAFTLKLIRTL